MITQKKFDFENMICDKSTYHFQNDIKKLKRNWRKKQFLIFVIKIRRTSLLLHGAQNQPSNMHVLIYSRVTRSLMMCCTLLRRSTIFFNNTSLTFPANSCLMFSRMLTISTSLTSWPFSSMFLKLIPPSPLKF